MHKTEKLESKEIHNWDEVSDFHSEAEEAAFWSNHCLGDEILAEMTPVPEDILPPPRRQEQSSNNVLRYAVVIQKNQGNYSAYVPDLQGCVAVSKTLEEVKQKIKETIASHLVALQADGFAIAQPTTECDYVEVVSIRA